MPCNTPVWAPSTPAEVLTVKGSRTETPVWTALTRKERNTGLLGTDSLSGALWITRCNWIHTFGMQYALDLVYLDRRGKVVSVCTTPPRRQGLPRFRASSTVEMPAGMASELGIKRGDLLGRIPA